ncbi:hypothetical protein AX768_25330 [Burkholderia sp. PAMC 28687]|uniref:hypothetical protein n=1 Tax=Burkholderia sp. PAMC 28687 TaxID=1795874 RepID=UPI0007860961|nr:hypothetical protein [Burkholderia sp. PAMC 28687]AMM17524.1 hypothetical protein AX768_25330 [Burkholderia sp. PAMC 28687]
MPFHDYWTPKPYDYDKATRGLAEKLQAYMDLAGEQDDEAVAEGIRGTALQIYERWYRYSTDAGKLKAEDDARCRKILKLPLS